MIYIRSPMENEWGSRGRGSKQTGKLYNSGDRHVHKEDPRQTPSLLSIDNNSVLPFASRRTRAHFDVARRSLVEWYNLTAPIDNAGTNRGLRLEMGA